MTQREKPMWTMDEVEATLGVRPTHLSGGQIENFRKGWAKPIFGGDKVHYFNRSGFDGAIAMCGYVSSVRSLYGGGNYPRCRRCESARKGRP